MTEKEREEYLRQKYGAPTRPQTAPPPIDTEPTPDMENTSTGDYLLDKYGHAGADNPDRPPPPVTQTEPQSLQEVREQAAAEIPETSWWQHAVGATAHGLQGLTMGWSDELYGAMKAALGEGDFSVIYEKEAANHRAQLAEYERRNPGVALTANLAGSIAPALIPGAGALTAGRLGASLAGRVGMGMASGAASGVASGAGYAAPGRTVEGAVQGGLLGTALGGAMPMVTSAIGRAMSTPYAKKIISAGVRDTADLGKKASGLYERASAMGGRIKPQPYKELTDRIVEKAKGMGMGHGPTAMPKVQAFIRDLSDELPDIVDEATGQVTKQRMHITPAMLDRHRRAAAERLFDTPDDARFGMMIREEIEDFMHNMAERGHVTRVRGNAAELGPLWRDSRTAFSLYKKAAKLDDIMYDAMDRAKVSSDTSFAKEMRKGLADLLSDEKAMNYYSSAEKKALARALEGGNWENFQHWVGQFAPSGKTGKGLWFLTSVVGGYMSPALAAALGAGGLVASASRAAGQRAAMKSALAARSAVTGLPNYGIPLVRGWENPMLNAMGGGYLGNLAGQYQGLQGNPLLDTINRLNQPQP